MKKIYRITATTLCAMLVLFSISYNALALRPMAYKVAGEQKLKFQPQKDSGAKEAKGKAADRIKAIEETASLKKINELLWKWNFKIDVLSHRRIFLRSQGRKTGNVFNNLVTIW